MDEATEGSSVCSTGQTNLYPTVATVAMKCGWWDVIFQHSPQEGYRTRQGILGDGGVAPDCVEEFVLGDKFVGVVEQVKQDAECLRLHGEDRARTHHTELPLPDLHVGESENKALLLRHRSITRPSEKHHAVIKTM